MRKYIIVIISVLFLMPIFCVTAGDKSQLTDSETATLQSALMQAFNTPDYKILDVFTAGNTAAKLFKIEVSGKSYVARFLDPSAALEAQNKEIKWLQYASEKGIGPKVYVADPMAHIIIMDYIGATQNAALIGHDYANSLGHDLKAIHTDDMIQKGADIFHPTIERIGKWPLKDHPFIYKIMRVLLKSLVKIEGIFRHTDVVPSHLDAHQDNILFDGNSFKFIDWETGALATPYDDLSRVANFVIMDDTKLPELLKSYFGRDPTKQEKAMFYLMRIATLIDIATKDLDRLPSSLRFAMNQTDFNALSRYETLRHDAFAGKAEVNDQFKLQVFWALIKSAYEKILAPEFKESLKAVRREERAETEAIKQNAKATLKALRKQ